jgi:hypothetical protein
MRVCFYCARAEKDGAALPRKKPSRERLTCDDCAALSPGQRSERSRLCSRLMASGNHIFVVRRQLRSVAA